MKVSQAARLPSAAKWAATCPRQPDGSDRVSASPSVCRMLRRDLAAAAAGGCCRIRSRPGGKRNDAEAAAGHDLDLTLLGEQGEGLSSHGDGDAVFRGQRLRAGK